MAIDSDDFCIRDIQFDWQYSEFLGNITSGFSNIAETVWAERYTSEYVRLSGHHLVLKASGSVLDGGATYPASAPTGRLSQGVLNDIYLTLYREAGDLASGIDESTGEPAFTIITGSEVLKDILQANTDIRQDTVRSPAPKTTR
jgi:hypothetical protein